MSRHSETLVQTKRVIFILCVSIKTDKIILIKEMGVICIKILVIGGTRFFGIPMVKKLIEDGHEITIATRGISPDDFGDRVSRVKINIYNKQSIEKNLHGNYYDIIIDKMGYGASDVDNILSNVYCDKFIHMSTAGVYRLDHFNIKEDEFDPSGIRIRWGTRGDFDYDELKRMAEAVLAQKYNSLQWSAVRCPFILGKKDYTNRLFFYVDNIMRGNTIYIDNLYEKMSVANGDEVGRFMAELAIDNSTQSINCCSVGEISLHEIVEYIQTKGNVVAKIDKEGLAAPYNGVKSYSLSLNKANKHNYFFSSVNEWIYELLDYYIWKIRNKREGKNG